MLQKTRGLSKLKQDIFHWLAEAYKIDRFHPQYGSTLSSYIGTNLTVDSIFEIEVETYRVLSNFQRYQKIQYSNNQERYTQDELLDTVIEVNVDQRVDNLYIEVIFVTAENSNREYIGIEVS